MDDLDDPTTQTDAVLHAWDLWKKNASVFDSGLYQTFEAGFLAGMTTERLRTNPPKPELRVVLSHHAR